LLKNTFEVLFFNFDILMPMTCQTEKHAFQTPFSFFFFLFFLPFKFLKRLKS